MLKKLIFAPGIDKNRTDYSNTGTWIDSDHVRFREGLPERIGGWEKFSATAFAGICRSLHRWGGDAGAAYTGVGTSRRFYIYLNGTPVEVTPIRFEETVSGPFDTTNLSDIVTVHHTAHGANVFDRVLISGSAAVGGITPLDGYTIQSVIDVDTYTIQHSSPATSTASGGGGASVLLKYLLIVGADSGGRTGAWGSGYWGAGYWGVGGTVAAPLAYVGLWTQAQWGVDVAICARDSFICYVDTSDYTSRAKRLDELSATDPPDQSIMILTSTRDRHLIAFGTSPEGGGSQDKMLIRWCDQEDITYWTTDDTHTAGSILLDRGSYIVSARATKSAILIWTDQALFTMGFIGPPFTFGVELVGDNIDIAGINAPIVIDDIAYWMGRGGFYSYDGAITKMPCPLLDFINRDVDWLQGDKIFAGTNRRFNEIMWLYPSVASEDGDCDKYICYDMKSGDTPVWYGGTLKRTAWLDSELLIYPIAAGQDTYLYEHEAVIDDGSVSPAVGVRSFIESAPFELLDSDSANDGQHWAFIRSIWHDVTFRGALETPNVPSLTMRIYGINRPGAGLLVDNTEDQIAKEEMMVVERFTPKSDVRMRARGMKIRIESSAINSPWRLGAPRLEMRTDGMR